jgi:hypothetical protein
MGVAAIGEIGMMRGVDRPADEGAGDEDRLGEDDVRQMRAAALIGVIADEDVAGPQIFDAVALEDVRDDADEAAEMHRYVLGLAERVAAHIEQHGRAVAAFLDVGGIARPHERFAHLLDDRGQRAPDHLHRDGIDLRGGIIAQRTAHQAASRIRLR